MDDPMVSPSNPVESEDLSKSHGKSVKSPWTSAEPNISWNPLPKCAGHEGGHRDPGGLLQRRGAPGGEPRQGRSRAGANRRGSLWGWDSLWETALRSRGSQWDDENAGKRWRLFADGMVLSGNTTGFFSCKPRHAMGFFSNKNTGTVRGIFLQVPLVGMMPLGWCWGHGVMNS